MGSWIQTCYLEYLLVQVCTCETGDSACCVFSLLTCTPVWGDQWDGLPDPVRATEDCHAGQVYTHHVQLGSSAAEFHGQCSSAADSIPTHVLLYLSDAFLPPICCPSGAFLPLVWCLFASYLLSPWCIFFYYSYILLPSFSFPCCLSFFFVFCFCFWYTFFFEPAEGAKLFFCCFNKDSQLLVCFIQ